ncbi:MAG: hypothetical protein ACE5QV_09155, partial [Fidelibacterota bacterium]
MNELKNILDNLEDFEFWADTVEIAKAQKDGEDWIIYIKAATEDPDLEEQITKSDAIQKALNY